MLKKSIRHYILVTLSHAEKRTLTREQILARVRTCFECQSIIVAKEDYKQKGFHYHVGIFNSTASKRQKVSEKCLTSLMGPRSTSS